MATPFNQGGQGTYIFGSDATPTDEFNDHLINVQIHTTRANQTKPATYGAPVVEDHPGDLQREMMIEFLGDPSDAGSFWSLLYSKLDDDGYIYFDVVFADGPVTAQNKRHKGQIVVNDFTIGSPVNTIWQQSVTYPIVNYTTEDA